MRIRDYAFQSVFRRMFVYNILFEDSEVDEQYLELDADSYNEADAVYIELEAGQISLHDVYLMHGSEANLTDQPRRGMTLRYMPTTSIYRRDRNKSPVDDQRPVFLMRGEDKSRANDFRVR